MTTYTRPPMSEPTAFGVWIKAQREAHGLSQMQVAAALRLQVTTVSRWERGKTDAPSGMQQRVREYFASLPKPRKRPPA